MRLARLLLLLAVILLGIPLDAESQSPGKVARVGYLALSDGPGRAAFRDGLRGLGWTEGQNLVLEVRLAGGKRERLDEQAAELVRLGPDVVVGASSLPAQALMRATTRIPIVVAAAADPLEERLVASLAHPGGNVTGVSLALDSEFSGKWVELLKAMTPRAVRFAVLVNPAWAGHAPLVAAARAAARSLSVDLEPYPASRPEDFPGAFARMTRDRIDGCIVLPSTTFATSRARLVELTVKHRLPTIFEHRLFTEAGGLMSYGPDLLAAHRRAAFYVDRIARGARPADLPVEQPTTFELVINRRAARALGLAIPPPLLVRADAIVE